MEKYAPYILSCVKTNLNTIILDGAFIFCVFNYVFMIYFSFKCIHKSRCFHTRLTINIYRTIFGI